MKAVDIKSSSHWHTQPVESVWDFLESSPSGLSEVEALRRLEEFGPNELQSSIRVSPWTVLLEQFKNALILILLVAVTLSAFLGHGIESIVIGVIVLFAVLLGFVQEFRAERAIEALRKMAAPMAMALRNGEETEVPSRELVPGDVVLLSAGVRVPADLRIIESINLQIEEAALTGESVAVSKHILPLEGVELALGDRKNMAFAGTMVTYGRGRAVVATTGMNTEFGKIARMLQTIETTKTPLQENLDRLGKTLARAALVIVGIIVCIGLLRNEPFIDMFIFGIALAVAVVPEALPAVVTISLAIGVQRMIKRNALVRRLSAVETLGSTSVICSDKTGTLTKDEMTARKVAVGGMVLEISGTGYEPHGQFLSNGTVVETPDTFKALLKAAALASDAHIIYHEQEERWRVKGDPTEGALVVAAAKAGFKKPELDEEFPRIGEIPFTSETKRMTTLHSCPEDLVAYAKGAPEIILDSCDRQLTEYGVKALDTGARKAVLECAHQMASEALRVLAIASKTGATLENAEQGMCFLGLVGMIDPPRTEAKAAIQTCTEAGIRVVMITGDHAITAAAVARELGLLTSGRVVAGSDLDAMGEAEFEGEVENIEVYARVTPAHKLRVVTALQKKGHIVAMTGDGVNDAPALKKADIGIAMGITGTDVSKEAADLTLTDDNFASIVAAIEEGRGIFCNIKKYLMYLLSSNIGEIILMAGASLAGLPLPLSAVQILYVNLATDGLPALALAVDPQERDIMRRKPRNPRTGIFTAPVIAMMLAGGLWSSVINLGIFVWALHSGRSNEEVMTMVFVSLALIQFFKAYNFRSDTHSVFFHPFANKWLNISILWEVALLLLVIYIPFFHEPFGTYSLPLMDWLIIISLALTICPVLELAKYLVRRGFFGDAT